MRRQHTLQCHMFLVYTMLDWMTDVRVLQGNFSSADIWMPSLDLIIMIDGEGHFGDHHGRSVDEQEEADDNFNYEALDRGLSVYRLHYLDDNLAQRLLSSTIAECRRQTRKTFIDWSPAFRRSRESL